MAEESRIVRIPLLSTQLGPKSITSVEVKQITFAPGQRTGRHKHPCPVFGYIADGNAVLQVEGGSPKDLPAGAAFHEPEGATILRFDNASADQPLTFIAYYLLDGNQDLIEMLPEP